MTAPSQGASGASQQSRVQSGTMVFNDLVAQIPAFLAGEFSAPVQIYQNSSGIGLEINLIISSQTFEQNTTLEWRVVLTSKDQIALENLRVLLNMLGVNNTAVSTYIPQLGHDDVVGNKSNNYLILNGENLGINISDFVEENKDVKTDPIQCLKFMASLTKSLFRGYHEGAYVNGNLKPETIFVTRNPSETQSGEWEIQILPALEVTQKLTGDFKRFATAYLDKIYSESDKRYVRPELLAGNRMAAIDLFKSDLYALGVIFAGFFVGSQSTHDQLLYTVKGLKNEFFKTALANNATSTYTKAKILQLIENLLLGKYENSKDLYDTIAEVLSEAKHEIPKLIPKNDIEAVHRSRQVLAGGGMCNVNMVTVAKPGESPIELIEKEAANFSEARKASKHEVGVLSELRNHFGDEGHRNLVTELEDIVLTWQEDDYEMTRTLAYPECVERGVEVINGLEANGYEVKVVFRSDKAEGVDLEDLIGQNLTPQQIFSIGTGIIEGMRALRGLELCHLDLKPANIKVKINPKTGVVKSVKIFDYGTTQKNTTNGYQPDAIGGLTPGYAPDEQYYGNIHPNSDVFSLGRILHQLFVGHAVAFDEAAIYNADPGARMQNVIGEQQRLRGFVENMVIPGFSQELLEEIKRLLRGALNANADERTDIESFYAKFLEIMEKYFATRDEFSEEDGVAERRSNNAEWEAKILKSLKRVSSVPDLITIDDSFDSGRIAVVLPFQGSSIADYVAKRKDAGLELSITEIQRIIFDILKNLSSVHHSGVEVRNLNKHTIYISEDLLSRGHQILFANLSCAYDSFRREGPLVSDYVDTRYLPPEGIRTELDPFNHYKAWDMYQIGLLLYEMLEGKPTFNYLAASAEEMKKQREDLYSKIIPSIIGQLKVELEYKKEMSASPIEIENVEKEIALYELLLGMVDPDPRYRTKRPAATKALSNLVKRSASRRKSSGSMNSVDLPWIKLKK